MYIQKRIYVYDIYNGTKAVTRERPGINKHDAAVTRQQPINNRGKMLSDETHPLVREGAPQQETRK
jgi:hypothetical protein